MRDEPSNGNRKHVTMRIPSWFYQLAFKRWVAAKEESIWSAPSLQSVTASMLAEWYAAWQIQEASRTNPNHECA